MRPLLPEHTSIDLREARAASLRVQIPWTSLGSQPLVLALDGVDCALDRRQRKSEAAGDDEIASSTTSLTPPEPANDGATGSSSYVASLLQSMAFNTSIKVDDDL